MMLCKRNDLSQETLELDEDYNMPSSVGQMKKCRPLDPCHALYIHINSSRLRHYYVVYNLLWKQRLLLLIYTLLPICSTN